MVWNLAHANNHCQWLPKTPIFIVEKCGPIRKHWFSSMQMVGLIFVERVPAEKVEALLVAALVRATLKVAHLLCIMHDFI